VAVAAGATFAVAQSLATPAEFPPTSYTGTQYVDSTGCAFVRAGNGAFVNWVPRVNPKREHLCGFQSTRLSNNAATTEAAGPIITFTDTPETQPAPAQVAAAPAPAPAAVAAPVPRRVTLAEVCEGKFGVQTGFATASGAPVDCGPAPVVATASAPATADPLPLPAALFGTAPAAAEPARAAATTTSRMTLAQACSGRYGVQAGFISGTTGQPIDCGPAPAPSVVASAAPAPSSNTPRRVTLDQICTEIAATGRSVINAATGSPVVCPSANAPTQLASAAPVTPPAGYERAWDDDRINPSRGVRRITREQAIAEGLIAGSNSTVSTRSVAPSSVRAPAAATSHRYVQVGSFGDQANADRLAARFQARGWPVTFSNATIGGQAVKIVILGPFSQPAQLQTGLQAARAAGFGDAFTRS